MNRPIDTLWEETLSQKKKTIWNNNSNSWKYNKYVERYMFTGSRSAKIKQNKVKENHKTTHHNGAVYNKYKRSILRAAREKRHITYRVIRIEMTGHLIRNQEDQKTVE